MRESAVDAMMVRMICDKTQTQITALSRHDPPLSPTPLHSPVQINRLSQ